MDQARAANPQARVEAWAFDEHRLGLKPLTRRVWGPRGQRPIARTNHRYQWLYLYGFVEPSSGEVIWYLFNTVNVAAFQKTLEAFARERGVGRTKIVILVLDNAGWHTSEKIKPPEGLILLFLPPYTPELQPAERLWPLANEAVANRSFSDIHALADCLTQRCLDLCKTTELIRRHTFFHWWPNHA